MKHLITAALLGLALNAVQASDHQHEGHNRAHTHEHTHNNKGSAAALNDHDREDIARHQAMARAHEQAAQCLLAGHAHNECQKELQANCKGLALGKHCGMRHSH